MTKHRISITMWIVLMGFTFACSFISGIDQQLQETRLTVEAAATQGVQDLDLVGTAKAVTTSINLADLAKTAESAATQAAENSLIITAQAVVTREAAPLAATAMALATAQGSGILETAQAAATEIAFGAPTPDDIPVITGDNSQFVTSSELVSYLTDRAIQDVSQFYSQQMPIQGWEKLPDGWFETEKVKVFVYQKQNRKATITITLDPITSKTIVLILIHEL